ncbi:MAG: SirB1 family protein [Terriglobia bacterium]
MAENLIRRFSRLMECEEERIPLLEAALMIAQTEYPNLSLETELGRFDLLASRLDASAVRSPDANIRALNSFLFEEQQFCGNEKDYDDPRNSFLNDVLNRKMGIPITLSLIYVELGKRHGLPLAGVGFPGHFLVKYKAASRDIFLDPFCQGEILSLEDCDALLKKHFGPEAKIEPQYLTASTSKEILARMLNNLKGCYFRRNNYNRVLTLVEMSLAIDPASRQDLHDRSTALVLLHRYREAAADLRAYVDLAPPGDPRLTAARSMLHRIRGMMN